MDLKDYLLVGSYLFGAAVWGMMWREFKALKNEVIALRLAQAEHEGREEGWDHEDRITRLERLLSGEQ